MSEAKAQKTEVNGWTIRMRQPQGEGPFPVISLLHGWTGDEDAMWVFASRLPPDSMLIAPPAPFKCAPEAFRWHPHKAKAWPWWMISDRRQRLWKNCLLKRIFIKQIFLIYVWWVSARGLRWHFRMDCCIQEGSRRWQACQDSYRMGRDYWLWASHCWTFQFLWRMAHKMNWCLSPGHDRRNRYYNKPERMSAFVKTRLVTS